MPDITMLMNNYFTAKRQIHEAFGYKANWAEIPLDDMTEAYWWFGQNRLNWCDEKPTDEEVRGDKAEYDAEIYMQRFLPRWVYTTETHTMVSIDTHTDGNKFLAVLSNTRYCGVVPLAKAIAKIPTKATFDKE